MKFGVHIVLGMDPVGVSVGVALSLRFSLYFLLFVCSLIWIFNQIVGIFAQDRLALSKCSRLFTSF